MARSCFVPFLKSSNKEDSCQYQKGGPKLRNDLIYRNDIEVAQQEESSHPYKCRPSPELHVSRMPELLIELIERGDTVDAFARQLSLLGGVVGLEWHVDIKSECQKTEQRFSGASGAIRQRHQC